MRLPVERRGGRVKGTPNKLTADLKAMIVGALADLPGRWIDKVQQRRPPKMIVLDSGW